MLYNTLAFKHSRSNFFACRKNEHEKFLSILLDSSRLRAIGFVLAVVALSFYTTAQEIVQYFIKDYLVTTADMYGLPNDFFRWNISLISRVQAIRQKHNGIYKFEPGKYLVDPSQSSPSSSQLMLWNREHLLPGAFSVAYYSCGFVRSTFFLFSYVDV